MNNFEQDIKSKLNKYNSDIDPAEIWTDIQNKRKKKRRFGFIWFAAAFLLLMGISALIINFTFKKNDNFKEITKKTNNKISNSKLIEKQEQDNYNITTNSNTTKNNENKKLISKNISIKKSLNHSYSESTKNNLHHILNPKKKQYKNIAKQTKSSIKIENDIAITNHLHQSNSIKALNCKQYYITSKTAELALNFLPKTNKYKKSIRPFYSMTFGANHTVDQFVLSDDNSREFLNNVKNNERVLEAFDINLGYNLPLTNSFSLYSGLNYGQIDSKLSFSYKTIRQIEIDSALTKIIINSVYDSLKIYERTKTNTLYNVKENIYNYKRYLRVPVMIVYNSNFNILKYQLRTGIDINIFTLNSGKAITPYGEMTTLSDTETNSLKNRILGDFHFDLLFEYPINSNLSLLIGPQYKVNIESFMQSKAGFDQYRHNFGINIGIKSML